MLLKRGGGGGGYDKSLLWVDFITVHPSVINKHSYICPKISYVLRQYTNSCAKNGGYIKKSELLCRKGNVRLPEYPVIIQLLVIGDLQNKIFLPVYSSSLSTSAVC